MSSFGELVKQHRKRNGIGQQELAKRVDINPSTLRLIENGGIASPSGVIVARIVEELHLTPFQATALLRALREDAESKEKPSLVEAT